MSTTGIPVNAQNLDPSISEFCHASWSCELAAVISDLWLLFVAGVLAVVLLAALSNLRAATDRVQEEQSRTAAERDAFRAFAKQVSDLSPDSMAAVGGSNGGTVASAVSMTEPARSVAKVREAYRETVMSVPHYDEDYGEPLAENMAFEFGEDVAASVEDGRQLSPMLQQALVSKAQTAAAERERLIGQLERENEDLKTAQRSLATVESELEGYDPPTLRGVDFDGLADRWDRLDELEERCTGVVEERQRTVISGRNDGRTDGPTLLEYLYGPLSVDYPVLADAAAVIERIGDARRAVAVAASRRA